MSVGMVFQGIRKEQISIDIGNVNGDRAESTGLVISKILKGWAFRRSLKRRHMSIHSDDVFEEKPIVQTWRGKEASFALSLRFRGPGAHERNAARNDGHFTPPFRI